MSGGWSGELMRPAHDKKGEKKCRDNPAFFVTTLAQSRLLANHSDIDFNNDIGVQSNGQRMIAGRFQRTLWHANLRLVDNKTLLAQCLSDIVVGYGTEQTTINAGLL
jgi:hypothetical protein